MTTHFLCSVCVCVCTSFLQEDVAHTHLFVRSVFHHRLVIGPHTHTHIHPSISCINRPIILRYKFAFMPSLVHGNAKRNSHRENERERRVCVCVCRCKSPTKINSAVCVCVWLFMGHSLHASCVCVCVVVAVQPLFSFHKPINPLWID